ncbi:MAG: hypothetical protein JEZ07_01205 [Phycisphaerae bacterium]|nr:hypothetical protein [Phycisphaerae bacterium]
MKTTIKTIMILLLTTVSFVWAGSPVTDGLIHHMDASTITGVADGQPVSSTTDWSPVGIDAVAPNAAGSPLYVVDAIGGMPALDFDGIDDFLTAANTAGTLLQGDNPFVVFAVCSVGSFGTGSHTRPLFGLGDKIGAGNREITHFCFEGPTDTWNRLVGGAPHWTTALSQDEFYLISNGYAGGGGMAYGMWVDGAAQTVAYGALGTHEFGGSSVAIGRVAHLYSATTRFDGLIAEMLVFNRNLTDYEINLVGSYLAKKYNLTTTYKDVYYAPQLVSPENTSVDVEPAGLTLNWTPGDDPNTPGVPNPKITGFDVYLGDSITTMTKQNATPLSASATSLAVTVQSDSKYFWYVKQLASSGDIQSDIFSFETVKTLPVLDSDLPADTNAMPQAGAMFMVSATNPVVGELEYQWCYDPNTNVLGDEVELEDDGRISGALTETLVIGASLVIADEGLYFCKVTNTTATVVSKSATLTVNRLVGHWKLDGNANDSSTTGADGAVIGTASWATGEDGQALNLDEHGVPYIEVPAARADAFNLANRMSVSIWVNAPETTTVNGYRLMIGKHGQAAPVDDRVWMLRESALSGDLQWFAGNVYHTFTGVKPFDGTWHHVAATFDITTGEKSVYLDGRLQATVTGVTGKNPVNDTSPIRIGYYYKNETVEPEIDYIFGQGMLDDARVYNYALTAKEVAEVYTSFRPEDPICYEAIAGDMDGDCEVGLSDLAAMAAVWLDSNRFYGFE